MIKTLKMSAIKIHNLKITFCLNKRLWYVARSCVEKFCFINFVFEVCIRSYYFVSDVCPVCNEQFTLKATLKQHIANKHPSHDHIASRKIGTDTSYYPSSETSSCELH